MPGRNPFLQILGSSPGKKSQESCDGAVSVLNSCVSRPDHAVDSDESSLILRARSGEEAAFAALVDRYAKPILNFAWRQSGDPTEAEDVAQDVFVRAWQHLNSFNPAKAAFSTWLFQIARNASIDRLRSRKRKPAEPLGGLAANPPSPEAGPDENARRSELGAAIARAVALLPEDQRTSFLLAEYHGQSMREIAAAMACSEKAVENRLYRARQFLRAELKGWI